MNKLLVGLIFAGVPIIAGISLTINLMGLKHFVFLVILVISAVLLAVSIAVGWESLEEYHQERKFITQAKKTMKKYEKTLKELKD
jgi:hypothetical protein